MAENRQGTTHESAGVVPDHGSAGDSVAAVGGQDIDSATDVREQAEGCNKVDTLPGPGSDGETNCQCAEEPYAGAKTIFTGGDTNRKMTIAEDVREPAESGPKVDTLSSLGPADSEKNGTRAKDSDAEAETTYTGEEANRKMTVAEDSDGNKARDEHKDSDVNETCTLPDEDGVIREGSAAKETDENTVAGETEGHRAPGADPVTLAACNDKEMNRGTTHESEGVVPDHGSAGDSVAAVDGQDIASGTDVREQAEGCNKVNTLSSLGPDSEKNGPLAKDSDVGAETTYTGEEASRKMTVEEDGDGKISGDEHKDSVVNETCTLPDEDDVERLSPLDSDNGLKNDRNADGGIDESTTDSSERETAIDSEIVKNGEKKTDENTVADGSGQQAKASIFNESGSEKQQPQVDVQKDVLQEPAANDKTSVDHDQESRKQQGTARAGLDGFLSGSQDEDSAEIERDDDLTVKKSSNVDEMGTLTSLDQTDGGRRSEAEMNQCDLCKIVGRGAESSTDNVETEKEWPKAKIPLSGNAILECSLVQADDTVTTLDTVPSPVESTVTSVMMALQGKLKFTELCENLMKLGQYLRLGTNAVADDATLLIMVQSALFDVVKLCDAVSLLMQNFKMSSNNIIEKLHVAFLYLLDGFPDFAKTDIECISKDVKSMQERGLKCLKVVETLKIKFMTSKTNDVERNEIEEDNRGSIKKSELWKTTVERIKDYVKYAGEPEWCDAFSELSNLSTRKRSVEKSEELSSGAGHKNLNKNEMNVVQDTTSGTNNEKNLNDSTSSMDEGCKQPTASDSVAAVGAAQIDDDESTVDRKLDGDENAASYQVEAHGSCTADGMNGNKNGERLSVDSLPVTNKTKELKSDSASEEVAENNGGKLVEHYGAATPDPAARPTAEKKDMSKTGSTSLPFFKRIISIVQNIDKPSLPQAPQRWFEKTPGNSTLPTAEPDDASNAKMAKLPIKQIPKVSDEKVEIAKQKQDSHHRVLLLQEVLQLSINTLGDIEDIITEANRLVDSWDAECKDVIEPWLVEGFGEADKLTQEDQKRYWKSLWFQQNARDYYSRWCALGAFCDTHHSEVKRVRKEVDAFYTENLYPREAVKFAWRLAENIDNDLVKGLIEKQKHFMN